MKATPRYKLIGLLAAGALSANAAQAALFATTAASTPVFTSDSPADVQADWSAGQVVLTLQKFDASLGTLTAVNFKFSGSLRSEYSITNGANGAQPVTITPTVGEMQFLLPDGLSETLDLLGQPRVLLSNLNDFIGPGLFNVDVLASAYWDIGFTDDLDDSSVIADGNARVQVSVTLTAHLTGTAKGEAMGSGGLITLVLESAITVKLPGGDPVAQLTLSPQALSTFNATSCDQVATTPTPRARPWR